MSIEQIIKNEIVAMAISKSVKQIEYQLKQIENLDKRATVKTVIIGDLCSGECQRKDETELAEMIDLALQ